MLRFAAARAGTYALNKPISAATPRVSANTKGGTCNETKGPRASALSAKTLNSPNATPQPIAPPDKATILILTDFVVGELVERIRGMEARKCATLWSDEQHSGEEASPIPWRQT